MSDNSKSGEKVNWSEFRPPVPHSSSELYKMADQLNAEYRKTKKAPDIPHEYTDTGVFYKCWDWIDRWHFVTRANGKPWVARIAIDPASDAPIQFCSPEGFHLLHSNWKPGFVEWDTNAMTGEPFAVVKNHKGITQKWWNSEHRREHSTVALVPPDIGGGGDPYVYNLWRGFGVEPKKGEWPKIKDFLLDVICNGSEENFEWLTRWMAYCVQHPGKQAEVAVVLQGKKGTGKGTLGKIMLELFRGHSFHVTKAEHFVGRFNGHLMKCLFVFADEAVWAGDKKAGSALKALITEDELAFEAKFQPTVMMPNRLKFLIASNDEWVVPATEDERRFFVLNVPEHRKGDTKYWTALNDALGDELPALFHDLRLMDLRKWDHRNPPHTEALNAQKLLGLAGFKRFWFDCLTDGEVPRGKGDTFGWPQWIASNHLNDAYRQQERGFKESNNTVGDILSDCGVPRKRLSTGGRPWGYQLPPLAAARAAFQKHMRIEAWDWPLVVSPDPSHAANDNRDGEPPASIEVVPTSQMSQAKSISEGNSTPQEVWARAMGQ